MLKVPYFFRGGIHPEGHKDMTARMPILTDLPLPDRLFLPLSMQSNATARPLVKAGDRVLKGQLVATSSASMSAHIHAPTSGKVLAIEDHVVPHPSGLKASTLIIECDGDDRWAEPPTTMDPFKLDPEQLANLVEKCRYCRYGRSHFSGLNQAAPGPALRNSDLADQWRRV
jgi:electron transport complex protein RnfC